jgi:hypothetical protein
MARSTHPALTSGIVERRKKAVILRRPCDVTHRIDDLGIGHRSVGEDVARLSPTSVGPRGDLGLNYPAAYGLPTGAKLPRNSSRSRGQRQVLTECSMAKFSARAFNSESIILGMASSFQNSNESGIKRVARQSECDPAKLWADPVGVSAPIMRLKPSSSHRMPCGDTE